jgi:ATPase domain predominantly from Archaea
MFQVKECELSSDLMPLDKQVTIKEEPLITGKHFIYIAAGKRGCGKSTLLVNLLKNKSSPYHKNFDNIYLISSSAKNDPKMHPLIDELEPESKFSSEFSDDILKEFLDRIQEDNENYVSEKEEFYSDKKNKKKTFRDPPKHLIILDDCLHEIGGSNKKTSVFKKLITTNRHLKTSVIITTQKYNGLGTLVRANADMLSLFPTHSKQEKESMMKDLAIDEDLFDKLFTFATDEPNSFLHINMNGPKPLFHKKFDKICFDKVDT